MGSQKAAPITHVLFDMDGLLLDTERFYTDVQERILASYGKTFDWSLKAKMMGKKALEAGKIFVSETGLDSVLTPEEFVPMAVATSSHRRHYELKTKRHEKLFTLMHHVVVGDDIEVKHGKPAPDIFLVAASRFEDIPDSHKNILVFEDAPSGVAAARSAGMSVVMVPDPNLDRSLCVGADQILDSLLDFEPSDWGLPEFH